MSSKVTSASLAVFGRIAVQLNSTSQALSCIKQRGVIPGGFPYNGYNGGGNVRPEALLSAVETARATIFNYTPRSKQSFIDVDKLYQSYFLFINASTMQIDAKMYDHNVCKGPLHFDVELDYVGKTSAQLKTSFFLDEERSSDPLFISRVSTVLVCNKTRVPKPAPDWWMDKYKSHVEEQGGGEGKSIGRLEFSGGDDSKSTQTKFKISPSDCDAYRHTNWSHYIRYCHEAFGAHRVSRLGGDAGYEFYRRGPRCFSIHYQKESSVGDELTVTVLPEKSDKDERGGGDDDNDNDKDDSLFYFTVVNSSKKVVCQSMIEYYPVMN